MAEIIPAVLPKSYEDLKDKVALFRGQVSIVQIDIADGIFVKNYTWPFTEGGGLDTHFHAIMEEYEGMPFWEDLDFEMDLMVADAVANFDIYTKLGPKRVIFHTDAVGNLEDFRDFLEGMDNYIRESMEFGIAVNTTTDLAKLFSIFPYIDFVQCMGIEHVGFQGQDFDERVLSQIKKIKENYKDIIVSVDGGVSSETAPSLILAGADRLVIGSAILNSNDIISTIEAFKEL